RLGHLHSQPDAPAPRRREQVDDDLEALRGDRLGARSIDGQQVVDDGEVGAQVVALVLELAGHLEVALARGEHDQLPVRKRARRPVDERRLLGHHRYFGVPTATLGWCSRCASAPRPVSSRRRVISPLRIIWCRVRMECIRVSGPGGQPGLYTSTGTTWSTPWTMAELLNMPPVDAHTPLE